MILQRLYASVVRYPWLVIVAVVALTVYFAMQLHKLHWETDARVYLPHGHPAIKYDEEVEKVFGVKDAVIIGIVNERKGIFNPVTLRRIANITREVASLPGVVANRTIDVASLATASVFYGTNTQVGSKRIMRDVPKTQAQIDQLKKLVYDNRDLLVGNLVSADGRAAMIRAKLKEGVSNRYQTYFQIKGILSQYGFGQGQGRGWSRGQGWSGAQGKTGAGNDKGGQYAGGASGRNAAQWQKGGQPYGEKSSPAVDNGDVFYIAGRPAIEVTSGLNAVKDIRVMALLLVAVIMTVLFVIFRTARGMLLPTFVMFAGIVWTMGIMALLNVPLYTISTMLPVILAAVGIGDAVHLLSHYYDNALADPQKSGGAIVLEAVNRLGAPLLTTTLTTAAGFMALLFAQMPPFRVFGVFIIVGIFLCWFLTITFIPAVLALMRPRVGGYLLKRKMMRVHNEQGWCSKILVNVGNSINDHKRGWGILIAAMAVIFLYGSSRLFVDSSWMSDFRKDSEISKATSVLNKEFNGTIFLNVVVNGGKPDALESPELLKKIEKMQDVVDSDPAVGDSLSLVNYVKSMNKTFHAGDAAYDVIPASKKEIAEYIYLFSISGRPEQLDEVADFNYRRANVTFMIKTDHTRVLKRIIDEVKDVSKREFTGTPVTIHLAGSANNSYVWADLLIKSQTTAIIISKAAIFIIATLLFRSLLLGLFTVIPVSLTTLLVAGFAGFAGIPLDVSTALAAGLAIGVGVDYSIHYIYRYWYERQNGEDHRLATAATMRSVGKTIAFNALIVAAGFSVLLLSQFPPNVKLGEFVGSYMVLSFVAALVTLPIMLVYKRKANQDPRG